MLNNVIHVKPCEHMLQPSSLIVFGFRDLQPVVHRWILVLFPSPSRLSRFPWLIQRRELSDWLATLGSIVWSGWGFQVHVPHVLIFRRIEKELLEKELPYRGWRRIHPQPG